MTCPRCGYDDLPGDVCPRCGVVPSKYRPELSRPLLRAGRPAPAHAGAAPPVPPPATVAADPPAPPPARRVAGPPPPPPAPRPVRRPGEPATDTNSDGTGRLLLGLGIVLVMALGVLVMARRPRARDSAPPAADVAIAPAAAPEGEPDPPPAPGLEIAPANGVDPTPALAGLDEQDYAIASEIAARLPGHPLPEDVARVEELLQRRPEQQQLRDLLAGVLMALAAQDLAARRFEPARQRFERAASLVPRDPRPHIGLHNVHAAMQNWPLAESAIRAALERDGSNLQAQRSLAYALFRQDRNREAREVLLALLERAEDAQARTLLARIEAGMADERGMTEQRLAHFHVRYQGEEHEDVGREILRVLERHYATLVVSLDFQPTTVVPVILFSREAYFDASGAPAWSGGVFDQIDGRIRIPIGGLTASLTPEMDATLLHELTHAFVHERTRGRAPRELHEGLAQYMEGRRIGELSDEQQAALAAGRIGGVGGFYLQALAFVEYLMAQRGQGGINDLMRVMGDRDEVDAAFREVYGQDLAALQRAFRQRFRQQTGA